MSRGGRLYVRHRDEFTEVGAVVRIIVASGFGFVITGDAIGVCVRRHIEIIVTDYAQSFVAIYAPCAPCQSNRACLTMRLRQFAAVADRNKKLEIAKDIVHRKIMTEAQWSMGHKPSGAVREANGLGKRGTEEATVSGLLADVAACKTVADVRHVEARSAQRWWHQWRDFKINFVRGFKPPEQWRSFQTRYIGRAQGKTGELSRQFTARFAETPLQAHHNFAVGIAVARITRIMAARGLDPRWS